MRCLEDEVLLAIYERSLAARIVAPQHEDEVLSLATQEGDDLIGESLPPASLMRACFVCYDRERSVQQEHSLTAPRSQMPPDDLRGMS